VTQFAFDLKISPNKKVKKSRTLILIDLAAHESILVTGNIQVKIELLAIYVKTRQVN